MVRSAQFPYFNILSIRYWLYGEKIKFLNGKDKIISRDYVVGTFVCKLSCLEVFLLGWEGQGYYLVAKISYGSNYIALIWKWQPASNGQPLPNPCFHSDCSSMDSHSQITIVTLTKVLCCRSCRKSGWERERLVSTPLHRIDPEGRISKERYIILLNSDWVAWNGWLCTSSFFASKSSL